MSNYDLENTKNTDSSNIHAEQEPPRLVQAMTHLLREAGHPHPDAWEKDPQLHRDAFTYPDEGVQRFLINRYWRMQIQRLPEDTMNVRYCLLDERHVKTVDWLRVFKEGVVPCILRNQLPAIS